MAELNLEKLKDILDKYGAVVISEMVAILNSKGARNLQQMIRKEMKEDVEYVSLIIKMPGYAKFADTGRGPGLMPPRDKIEKWVRERGIDESAVYPIRKKIAERGWGPGKDFIKVFYERYPEYRSQLIEAYKGTVLDSIQTVLNQRLT